MNGTLLHLKDYFPPLGENGADPTLEVCLCYSMHGDPRPGVLLCPGGAYAFVSDREAEPIAAHLLAEGFNVFILTYSVAPHRFPTQLREVAAALELIHQSAADWRCDPARLALMGFSAGGHLAASYLTQYDCPEVRALFPDSKAVSAGILCYPVITADWSFTHQDSMKNLLGHQPDAAETLRFSGERNVTPQTPPTFLWHTAADDAVPVKNSLVFSQALAAQGVPFELHVYPRGGHGLSTCDGQTCDTVDADTVHDAQWLTALKRWLNTYVK